MKAMDDPAACTVCGERDFSVKDVLWAELARDWQLSPWEAEYINRQQGLCCMACGNNLRAMALASAIAGAYGYRGTLAQFIASGQGDSLRLLEINEAGGLTPFLSKLPNHRLAKYPDCDMAGLSFESESFDLVVHSDTLEHVPNPVAGLSECGRVLAQGGRCIFTVPVVVGRFSRDRTGLKESYHGREGERDPGNLVRTEFGADVWRYVLEAGFRDVRIHSLEYPTGLAIEASGAHGR